MLYYSLDFEKPLVELERKLAELKKISEGGVLDSRDEVAALQKKIEKKKKEIFSSLTPWQRCQIARHPKRPTSLDYIDRIFDEFIELHGDRLFRDDEAIVAGIGYIGKRRVAIVAQQKGRDMNENIRRSFGSPHPEGYRKAQRIFRLAEKFKLPLISFIDTQGAFPGLGAEERGQGEAIAKNLEVMALLRTPIIVMVLGEGGSGGALAIGIGDCIYMLENAIYSVISPEGCAAILWKDQQKVKDAAQYLKLTAEDLLKLKVIDGIIKEPLGGAHKDYDATALSVKKRISSTLSKYAKPDMDKVIEKRYLKYRNIKYYSEG